MANKLYWTGMSQTWVTYNLNAMLSVGVFQLKAGGLYLLKPLMRSLVMIKLFQLVVLVLTMCLVCVLIMIQRGCTQAGRMRSL